VLQQDKSQGQGRTFKIPNGQSHDGLPVADDIESATLSDPSEVEVQEEQVQGVYIISVAARILDMHPQTLRKYERLGLIRPSRTVGMLRLYSQEDIEKLRLIRYLEEELGMNLAGVVFTLKLVNQLMDMQQRLRTQAQMKTIHETFRQEMRRLFERLNLPMRD
jgi:DNA-binding transcriptional MerR regulator